MVAVHPLIDGAALIAIVHHIGNVHRGFGRAITPSECDTFDMVEVVLEAGKLLTYLASRRKVVPIKFDVLGACRTQVSLDTIRECTIYGHTPQDATDCEKVTPIIQSRKDAQHLSAIAHSDGHIDKTIFRERVLHGESTAVKECISVGFIYIGRLGAIMSAKETRRYYPRKPIALPFRLVVEEVAKMYRTIPIEVVAIFGHHITMEA